MLRTPVSFLSSLLVPLDLISIFDGPIPDLSRKICAARSRSAESSTGSSRMPSTTPISFSHISTVRCHPRVGACQRVRRDAG